MASDTYLTIQNASEGLFKDKGSKFLGFAYPISSDEDVKPLIDLLKKEHHSARHHCWAYRLGNQGEQWRVNDDGEPSNSAGKPILGQIQSKGLTNVLVVVVRYFGGTLLGVGGLIQAYKEATADTLNNAIIIEAYAETQFTISFPFETMNDIMKLLKDKTAKIIKQDFNNQCVISFSVRQQHEAFIREKIKHYIIE